jgi:hypothetical protein
LNRTLDSEDDEDATSWDGGDDDDDEPDQMDLDEEDDDAAAAADDDDDDEEDDGEQSLMVTLRYRKGGSDVPEHDSIQVNGKSEEEVTQQQQQQQEQQQQPTGAPPPPQQVDVAPTAQSIPNGNSTPLQIQDAKGVFPAAEQQQRQQQQQQSGVSAGVLPKSDGFFTAPTPPYSAPEETKTEQEPVGQDVDMQQHQ